jgi:hypothetical protein
MSGDANARWLKWVYLYNIVGAGSFGLGIVAMPELMRATFGWPDQDPIVYGVMGSMWLCLGLLSILGLRSPLQYVPILLLQLSYKVVWLVGIALPLALGGRFPGHGMLYVMIFVSYVVADLAVIPFRQVLGKPQRQAVLEKEVLLS